MPGVDLVSVLESQISAKTTAPEVRGAALLALPSSEREKESAFLLGLVGSDPEPYVRACAVAILGLNQAQAMIAALADDTSPLVRRFAAARLTENPTGAIAALERALADPDPAVRTTVAQALSENVCCGSAPLPAEIRTQLQGQAAVETDAGVVQSGAAAGRARTLPDRFTSWYGWQGHWRAVTDPVQRTELEHSTVCACLPQRPQDTAKQPVRKWLILRRAVHQTSTPGISRKNYTLFLLAY